MTESKDNGYVTRMEDEGKALRQKIYALSGFLNGKKVHLLTAERQALMTQQLSEMQAYSDTLDKRIALEHKEHM